MAGIDLSVEYTCENIKDIFDKLDKNIEIIYNMIRELDEFYINNNYNSPMKKTKLIFFHYFNEKNNSESPRYIKHFKLVNEIAKTILNKHFIDFIKKEYEKVYRENALLILEKNNQLSHITNDFLLLKSVLNAILIIS